MKTEKVRKTITLSDDIDMLLRVTSAKSRKSASSVIEEALRAFLQSESK